MEMENVCSYDLMFLSELAGDETTYSRGWGSWMSVCAEDAVSRGWAERGYKITNRGLEVLDQWGTP